MAATKTKVHETQLDQNLAGAWKISIENDRLFLPQGLNLGNNELKGFNHSDVIEGNFIGLTSCFATTTSKDVRSSHDTVVFEEGSGKKRIRYVFGRGAYDLPGYKEIGDLEGSKREYQRIAALAFYAHVVRANPRLAFIKTIESPVVVSSPYEGLSEELIRELKGEYMISIDGVRELEIKITDVKVTKECRASGWWIQRTESPQNGVILIDIGNGDFQFSYTSPNNVFIGDGMNRGRGVRRLFEELTECSTVMKAKAEAVSYLAVKEAVESNDLSVDLGALNGKVDFSKEYKALLKEFVNEIQDALRNWVAKKERSGVKPNALYYVIGGGAKLPGLKELLNERLKIYGNLDPQYVESLGLTCLANSSAKGGAA